MFCFRIKQIMQGILAWFVVFTLRHQKEIVVAVEEKALRDYWTRSSSDFIGNKDVFCQGAMKIETKTGKNDCFQNIYSTLNEVVL